MIQVPQAGIPDLRLISKWHFNSALLTFFQTFLDKRESTAPEVSVPDWFTSNSLYTFRRIINQPSYISTQEEAPELEVSSQILLTPFVDSPVIVCVWRTNVCQSQCLWEYSLPFQLKWKGRLKEEQRNYFSQYNILLSPDRTLLQLIPFIRKLNARSTQKKMFYAYSKSRFTQTL